MSIKDCIEHLYSWDYTLPNAYGCPGCVERERIIKIISEWDLPVNQGTYTVDDSVKSLIALIKGENK